MATLTYYSTTLVAMDCYRCGVPFGVPQNLDERNRTTRDTFWCPNGHGQVYTKTRIARLSDEVAQLKTEVAWQRDQRKAAENEVQTAKHALRAEKGAKTKLKKRIANGVCPACKRHFANVQAHMEGQHPDYTA